MSKDKESLNRKADNDHIDETFNKNKTDISNRQKDIENINNSDMKNGINSNMQDNLNGINSNDNDRTSMQNSICSSNILDDDARMKNGTSCNMQKNDSIDINNSIGNPNIQNDADSTIQDSDNSDEESIENEESIIYKKLQDTDNRDIDNNDNINHDNNKYDIINHDTNNNDAGTDKHVSSDESDACASDKSIKDKGGTDKKNKLYNLLHKLSIIGFVIFAALFINETVIQPIRIKNSIDLTRDLYKKPGPSPKPTQKPTQKPTPTLAPSVTKAPEPTLAPTPTPDPNRDEQGRLLQFSELLAVNDDVKGWITIPDTNIDYVVVQSDEDNPELYLDKDINLEYSKAGTLFLDIRSSVEKNTQSLVIYGHNMVSTPEKMFRDLIKYKVSKTDKSKDKVPSFYKKHPVINFDTIYQTGQWKIFAVFITNGSDKKEPFFDYTRSSFKDSSDFLNYVYQLRIRSELNIDTVDITDTDQLLVLSTCSYEVDDYRTVVVARRVRDGEDPAVDVDSVTVNKTPLYPNSYYYRYGGKAPQIPETFEEALASGMINWYTPPELVEEKLRQDTAAKANAENQEESIPSLP